MQLFECKRHLRSYKILGDPTRSGRDFGHRRFLRLVFTSDINITVVHKTATLAYKHWDESLHFHSLCVILIICSLLSSLALVLSNAYAYVAGKNQP